MVSLIVMSKDIHSLAYAMFHVKNVILFTLMNFFLLKLRPQEADFLVDPVTGERFRNNGEDDAPQQNLQQDDDGQLEVRNANEEPLQDVDVQQETMVCTSNYSHCAVHTCIACYRLQG